MPLRIGSVAAVVGSVVLMIATLLHPLDADPGDPVAAFTEYAADDFWIASHLGQFLGIGLMFAGLFALRDSLGNERIGWIARMGLYVALAALVTTAALQAIDGVALKVMVDNWANAAGEQKQATFQAALAVRQIEVGVASFMAMLFGAAIVLFGVGIALATIYPAWVGWLGVIGGAGTIVGGVMTAFTGFSIGAMRFAMPFNLVLVLWMVAIGVLLWRRAGHG